MATGRGAKGLFGNTPGTIASMMSRISELTAQTGAVQGQAYANAGQSLAAGISQVGANRRRAQEQAAARAEREAARAEGREEREAARAERAADRREDRAFRERSLSLQERLGQARIEEARAAKLAQEKAAADDEAAQIAAYSQMAGEAGQEPPPVLTKRVGEAQARSQEIGTTLESLIAKIQQRGPVPSMLQVGADGQVTDLTSLEEMQRQDRAKYEKVLSDLATDKRPRVKIAATAAEKSLRWRMSVRAAGIDQAKQQKAEEERARKAFVASQELAQKQDALIQTVDQVSAALGFDRDEARRLFQGDIQRGNDISAASVHSVLASVTKGRKPEEPDPTPDEKGMAQGDQRFVADEQERSRRLAMPEEERIRRAEEEYQRAKRPNMQDEDEEALFQAVRSKWGL